MQGTTEHEMPNPTIISSIHHVYQRLREHHGKWADIATRGQGICYYIVPSRYNRKFACKISQKWDCPSQNYTMKYQ